jgi:hypothetical protein
MSRLGLVRMGNDLPAHWTGKHRAFQQKNRAVPMLTFASPTGSYGEVPRPPLRILISHRPLARILPCSGLDPADGLGVVKHGHDRVHRHRQRSARVRDAVPGRVAFWEHEAWSRQTGPLGLTVVVSGVSWRCSPPARVVKRLTACPSYSAPARLTTWSVRRSSSVGWGYRRSVVLSPRLRRSFGESSSAP